MLEKQCAKVRVCHFALKSVSLRRVSLQHCTTRKLTTSFYEVITNEHISYPTNIIDINT